MSNEKGPLVGWIIYIVGDEIHCCYKFKCASKEILSLMVLAAIHKKRPILAIYGKHICKNVWVLKNAKHAQIHPENYQVPRSQKKCLTIFQPSFVAGLLLWSFGNHQLVLMQTFVGLDDSSISLFHVVSEFPPVRFGTQPLSQSNNNMV